MKNNHLDIKVRVAYESNRFARDFLSEVYEKLKPPESVKMTKSSESKFTEDYSKNHRVQNEQ